MQRNMWDRKEDALNRRLEALAAREDWEGVLRELDQYDANNERRHQEHQIRRRLCLFQEEAWLDIIFSQREEDLPELVSEYPLSAALRELTPQQREILRLNLVFDIPARELAERAGCTTRNITKLRQKALEKLRDLVGGGQPETTLPKTG